MYDVYLKNIKIEKVRHLTDVSIPICEDKKNLIITGKNGSGKTSLLNAIAVQLNNLVDDYQDSSNNDNLRADIVLNDTSDGVKQHFGKGDFVLAYYTASRKFDPIMSEHVEKVILKDCYSIYESPGNMFIKYMLERKVTEALARTSGKEEKAGEIHNWFENLETILKKILDDDTIRVTFDDETFAFGINQEGRPEISLNELSNGISAMLDIVTDLIMRMEKHANGSGNYDLPGIVLIDEIEVHLHRDMQKIVMDILEGAFPNIQFIITTNSWYITDNIGNAVVYYI
nr:AAA family ATPase [Lachnospiraceae bacterium]